MGLVVQKYHWPNCWGPVWSGRPVQLFPGAVESALQMLRHRLSYYWLPAGSAAAALPVLFLLTADFWVFRPAGTTYCTDQGEIWQGEANRRSAPLCQTWPWSVQEWGFTAPKTGKNGIFQRCTIVRVVLSGWSTGSGVDLIGPSSQCSKHFGVFGIYGAM